MIKIFKSRIFFVCFRVALTGRISAIVCWYWTWEGGGNGIFSYWVKCSRRGEWAEFTHLSTRDWLNRSGGKSAKSVKKMWT
jgi:hypothetical protein